VLAYTLHHHCRFADVVSIKNSFDDFGEPYLTTKNHLCAVSALEWVSEKPRQRKSWVWYRLN